MRPLALFSLSLFLILGCEVPPRTTAEPPAPQATQAAQTAQAAKKTYGEPVSSETELVSLADLLKNPSRYAEKTIRTEGTVTAVCQSKGCWLELGDDKGMAHVKLGNHRFFVPRSASGQHATVQARVMAQVDKGHCEQEAEEQTGKVAKVELDATGVELVALR